MVGIADSSLVMLPCRCHKNSTQSDIELAGWSSRFSLEGAARTFHAIDLISYSADRQTARALFGI